MRPSLVVADLANMEAPGNLHVGFLALHRFSATYGRLPNLWLVPVSAAFAMPVVHFCKSCESSNKVATNTT